MHHLPLAATRQPTELWCRSSVQASSVIACTLSDLLTEIHRDSNWGSPKFLRDFTLVNNLLERPSNALELLPNTLLIFSRVRFS
jgi:hypothetical protein